MFAGRSKQSQSSFLVMPEIFAIVAFLFLQADRKSIKQKKKAFKFNTDREKVLLSEVINFNPFQYEHEAHAWAELAAAVTSAINEEGIEISGRCVRDKNKSDALSVSCVGQKKPVKVSQFSIFKLILI